jgi:transglutaminase-like putative cysteine protease
MPPLLGAAALLFWGWQTGLWAAALPLAVLLEGPRLVATRFEIGTRQLARLFDYGLLLAIGTGGYLSLTGSPTDGVVAVLQWLPVLLGPCTVAQAWSRAGRIDLKALWSNRQRRDPPPARPYAVDFRWLYLPLCLVAASAVHQRTPLFFTAAALLGGWALWVVRPRRAPAAAWTCLLLLAVGLGYGGQLALHRLQGILVDLSLALLAGGGGDVDPYRTRTALGQIGELKLSGAVLLRVTTADGTLPPPRLRRASYDSYSGGAFWYAGAAALVPLDGEVGPAGAWQFGPAVPGEREVRITALLQGERALLAVPPGTRHLAGLAVDGLRANRLGVLEATPVRDGLVTYRATYGDAFDPLVAAPTQADLEIPAVLRPTLAAVAAPLRLDGLPPEAALARLAAWFDAEFGYALYQSADTIDRPAVIRFLVETRAGHCEYFATATVLLLRLAGIPARYATGFAVQEWSALEKAWVVRRRHAHAWAEAHIDGRWITVDTTPATWAGAEAAHAAWWQPAADGWARPRFGHWRCCRHSPGSAGGCGAGWRTARSAAARRPSPCPPVPTRRSTGWSGPWPPTRGRAACTSCRRTGSSGSPTAIPIPRCAARCARPSRCTIAAATTRAASTAPAVCAWRRASRPAWPHSEGPVRLRLSCARDGSKRSRRNRCERCACQAGAAPAVAGYAWPAQPLPAPADFGPRASSATRSRFGSKPRPGVSGSVNHPCSGSGRSSNTCL